MTNEVSYAPIKYVCNGLSVDFAFPWKIFQAEDLIVTIEGQEGVLTLELEKDFTVDFDDVGGNVKTNRTWADGVILVIARNTDDYQSKDFTTSTGFQASEIEKAFDRVSCNLQEMDYNIENFKETFSKQIGEEIDELENVIEENKQEVLLIQERFEDDLNNQFVELKADVDIKIATVASAAEKIETLDESIKLCQDSAEIATEQAEIAVEKANEVLNVKDKLEDELDSKADKTELDSKADKIDVDGQWVDVAYNIASSFTLNSNDTKTYSLASCLPNDGYNYEVMITVGGLTGSKSGDRADVALYSSVLTYQAIRMARATAITNNSIIWGGTIIMPIGLDRNISILQQTTYSCTVDYFRAVGYRRIGTNV